MWLKSLNKKSQSEAISFIVVYLIYCTGNKVKFIYLIQVQLEPNRKKKDTNLKDYHCKFLKMCQSSIKNMISTSVVKVCGHLWFGWFRFRTKGPYWITCYWQQIDWIFKVQSPPRYEKLKHRQSKFIDWQKRRQLEERTGEKWADGCASSWTRCATASCWRLIIGSFFIWLLSLFHTVWINQNALQLSQTRWSIMKYV